MTERERRLADIQADMNMLKAEKEKLEKVQQDLSNQVTLLNLFIAAKIENGEDVSEYLAKQEDLNKELYILDDKLDDLLDKTKNTMKKLINLVENTLF